MAIEASLIRSFRSLHIDPACAKVLDVGCGGGGGLFQFLRLGFRPENYTGIDVQASRIACGRALFPNAHFIHGDATALEFAAGTFDLVFESTMFMTLPCSETRRAIAAEMVRVCRPGGYLLLVDWRTPKFGDPDYCALGCNELRRLFSVGKDTDLLAVQRGALVPPVGRFLSARAPWAYFVTAAVLPMLVGQVAYALERRG